MKIGISGSVPSFFSWALYYYFQRWWALRKAEELVWRVMAAYVIVYLTYKMTRAKKNTGFFARKICWELRHKIYATNENINKIIWMTFQIVEAASWSTACIPYLSGRRMCFVSIVFSNKFVHSFSEYHHDTKRGLFVYYDLHPNRIWNWIFLSN